MLSRNKVFAVGDYVLQDYQRFAPLRLILGPSESSEYAWAHDPELGIIRVHTWSHTLVEPATAESRSEAERIATSEEFRECVERQRKMI